MTVDAVEELIQLTREIEPQIGFISSPPDPLSEGDGGRRNTRIQLANRWMNELLPKFEAARRNSRIEPERRAITNLRGALADAIIRGADGDAGKVSEARVDLESCPGTQHEGCGQADTKSCNATSKTIPVAPRFKTPPCPICKGKAKTAKGPCGTRTRQLKCLSKKCGHTWKLVI